MIRANCFERKRATKTAQLPTIRTTNKKRINVENSISKSSRIARIEPFLALSNTYNEHNEIIIEAVFSPPVKMRNPLSPIDFKRRVVIIAA